MKQELIKEYIKELNITDTVFYRTVKIIMDQVSTVILSYAYSIDKESYAPEVIKKVEEQIGGVLRKELSNDFWFEAYGKVLSDSFSCEELEKILFYIRTPEMKKLNVLTIGNEKEMEKLIVKKLERIDSGEIINRETIKQLFRDLG